MRIDATGLRKWLPRFKRFATCECSTTPLGTCGARGNAPKIDVHAHYLPPDYRRLAAEAGHDKPDGMPGLPEWDPERAIDFMDRMNIRAALLSISSPGVHFGNDEAARSLARYVNEEGAKAARNFPGRFGLFASLPLPDIDGALAEIGYAFDELQADGIVLESNHHGIYLGDAKFEAVFAELNRRRAVVFIHPTSPNCPGCLDLSMGYPRPMMEFLFDTTRAVMNLILSGTLDRYPNMRIIVPHAGAALPILADRIVGLSPALGFAQPVSETDLLGKLGDLYYDLAGMPVPRLLSVLQQIANPKRILYGSDWPFTPDPLVQALATKLSETPLLDAEDRQRIYRDNALALFPRLRSEPSRYRPETVGHGGA